VEPVADEEQRFDPPRREDTPHALEAGGRVVTDVFHQDRVSRHTTVDQVGLASFGFGVLVAQNSSTGHHDQRGVSLLIQVECCVEPCFEDLGRDSVELRRPQDHDGIGWARLVHTRLPVDRGKDQERNQEDPNHDDCRANTDPAPQSVPLVRSFICRDRGCRSGPSREGLCSIAGARV